MKYRHKLTILLVTASLVPMILLVLYSHDRMSSLLREKEMEDMSSILEQTGEGIDSQIEVFSSLLNYLTYSPDIEDLITEKNMDNYQAYRKYTEVADPLLSVPKSYHDAIIQIQLFAESIKVRHEYTLVPLSEVDKEWWYDKLEEDVSVQWVVDSQIPEIAAVRRIYTGRETGIILIFLHQTFKMRLQLLHIFAGNVFGNLLHQTGILCLRIHWLAVRGLIIKHMHIWMIKFLLHGLLQLGHDFRQRLMPFKPAAHCKVKTCRVILLQKVI